MMLELETPIIFLDIETTGLNYKRDKIIDMSLIKLHTDGREEVMSILVNPEIPIPSEATAIHGITNEDVADKPPFAAHAEALVKFIEECILAGFNIDNFDLPLLKEELKRAGIELGNKSTLDVKAIYHKLEPRDLITAYKKYCGGEFDAHKSIDDARATMAVLNAQLESNPDLPRNVAQLRKFYSQKDVDWVDDGGRFIWLEGEVFFNFGKHNGESLKEVFKNAPDYFTWMLDRDFPEDAKSIARNAFDGKFPIKPFGS